jgi:hypothetical protein
MKKLLLVALLAIAGVTAWRMHDAPGRGLLQDRVWIDHVPRNDRDVINVFVAVSDQSVGAFNQASAWRGAYEGFRYEASGDELRLLFPQTGDRERVTAKARKCDVGGMDYCLEVSGSSRGVKRYYSRKGWEIDRVDDIPSRIRALAN